jgi:hypothetical protein
MFAKTIIQQEHLHRQASSSGTDQPTFALNPLAQVLQVGTGLTRGVAGDQPHGARIFCHMHVHVLVGLKLAIHHQQDLAARPISAAGSQQGASNQGLQKLEL